MSNSLWPHGLQHTRPLCPSPTPRVYSNSWATSLSPFTFMHWRRKWQPTPVFLPGESQGRGAWWAAVYGVTQSRTRLKRLSSSMSIESVMPTNHLSSVIPFSSCLQSFPASRSFPMSHLFASGGQTIGVSASTSVLPINIQDWSPLGWTGCISLQSKGLSRVFNTTVQKHQFFGTQLSLYSNSHI